jgi:hypothetical protein
MVSALVVTVDFGIVIVTTPAVFIAAAAVIKMMENVILADTKCGVTCVIGLALFTVPVVIDIMGSVVVVNRDYGVNFAIRLVFQLVIRVMKIMDVAILVKATIGVLIAIILAISRVGDAI